MSGKELSFKASVESADRSEPSSRTARRFAIPLTALLSLGLLAPLGCSVDLKEVFGSGAGTGGSGGTGGTGGSSTTSTTSSTTSSSSSSSTSSTSSTTSSSSSSTTSSTSSTTSSTSSSSSTTSSTTTGPVLVTVLPESSVYHYWDMGSVAAGWAGSGFNDGAWATGTAPLGYGDAYIVTTVGYGPSQNAKYISTWFRATFDVTDAASVTLATLELNVDDGAVAFMNGTEWVRWNMPEGAISPDTLASSIVDGAQENAFIAFAVDPSLLVEGKNVLAVEVHQAVANSSDLGFDARITVQQN